MKKVWKGFAAAVSAAAIAATGFIGATSAHAVMAPGRINITGATDADTFTGYMPFVIASESTTGEGDAAVTTYQYTMNAAGGFTDSVVPEIINKVDPNSGITSPTTDAKVSEWVKAYFGADNGAGFAKTPRRRRASPRPLSMLPKLRTWTLLLLIRLPLSCRQLIHRQATTPSSRPMNRRLALRIPPLCRAISLAM